MSSHDPNPPGDEAFHRPVLLDSVVHWILTDPSGIYVDGTAGGGGHSGAILARLNPGGRMVLIDRDEEAVSWCKRRFAAFPQVDVVYGELQEIDTILKRLNILQVDGFLLDLGVSSRQIDLRERGFSYSMDNPLDMRMDRRSTRTAVDVLNTAREEELADLFYYYGEERKSRTIARRIVREREKRPFDSSDSLNAVVRRVVPGRWHVKTLARIYQALRIEVNDELNQLKTGLEAAYPMVRSGGRVVVIAYHSLEDRIVKQFFRGGQTEFFGKGFEKVHPRFLFQILTRRVVRPSPDEIRTNPRARSARLRAAEKMELP